MMILYVSAGLLAVTLLLVMTFHRAKPVAIKQTGGK
ncbi:MAG: hypothetical protein ACI92Z_000055 [Paracoccaceae bacterium]|jgi:hypothetical protein